MSINRTTQYLLARSRLPAATAAATTRSRFVVVPAVLVAAGEAQAEIYRTAFARACEQVASRQRARSIAGTAYLWN